MHHASCIMHHRLLLTKVEGWAYSWYFSPACCLLRFAAFFCSYLHKMNFILKYAWNLLLWLDVLQFDTFLCFNLLQWIRLIIAIGNKYTQYLVHVFEQRDNRTYNLWWKQVDWKFYSSLGILSGIPGISVIRTRHWHLVPNLALPFNGKYFIPNYMKITYYFFLF